MWDSTAETRFIVLPMRPAGTEGWSEDKLADLVTRDSMIGTGLPLQARPGGGVMDGVHDMGGMDGFGKVEAEQNEPPFHAPWEGRVLAMQRAMGYAGAWHIDHSRFAQEKLPPLDYLAASYYQRWMLAMESNVTERGYATPRGAEGRPRADARARTCRASSRPDVVGAGLTRSSFYRQPQGPQRFKPGDRVRTKNIHPTTHTRLPRYARGKVGVVELCHGCHMYPDSVATDRGDNPQWLYTVVFDEPGVVGPGRRSDAEDLDRRVRAVSRPGVRERMTTIDPAAARRAPRGRARAFPAMPRGRCSASRGRRRPSP